MESIEWFRATLTTDDRVVVDFQPGPNQRWNPTVLQDNPLELPREFVATRTVHLRGRGSCWMYAAAGAAAGENAADLSVELVAIDSTVCAACGGDSSASGAGWVESRQPAGEPSGCVLEFRKACPELIPETDADATAIRAFARSACAGYRDVALTGRGPNWGYAALAAGAVDAGVERVVVWPVDTDAIVCWSRDARGPLHKIPPWLLDSLGVDPDAPRGMTVGVIGDPNSGKSVLSFMLERVFGGSPPASLRHDCDLAAPTPAWFMRREANNADGEETQRLRAATKQPWTHEMELAAAESLARLKGRVHIVVADLPGGNHNVTPAARIPPGREVIMREIDRFVLVARSEAAIEGWREALAEHGLADRLVAIVETRDPQAALSLSEAVSFPGRWRVTGLDRRSTLPSATAEPSPADRPWHHLAKQIVGDADAGC